MSAPLDHRRRAVPLAPVRRGFTLAELMVVLVIISILAGILIWGLRSADSGLRERNTRQTFDRLAAMFEEHERAGQRLVISNPGDLLETDSSGRIAVRSPEAVTRDAFTAGTIDRYGSPALIITQQAMAQLALQPVNRELLASIPQDDKLGTVPSEAPTATINTLVANANAGTGMAFLDRNGNGSINDADFPLLPDPPVLVDAWGNPILFVPAGVQLRGFGAGVIAGLTGLDFEDGTADQTVTSRDGRPFFVSAGPDGNFRTADDNLYSRDVRLVVQPD